jgi:hypothetical protein
MDKTTTVLTKDLKKQKRRIKFTSHFNAFKMPKIKGLLVEDNCRIGWKKWDGQTEMEHWPAQKS